MKPFIQLLLLIFVLSYFNVNAQYIDKLADKALKASGKTIERKTEEKSRKITSDAFDETFNEKKTSANETPAKKSSPKEKSAKNPTTQNNTGKESSPVQPDEIKSAKDFVAGTKVIATDNFLQDAIGDFPVNWTTNSSGEVVTISGSDEKWLKLSSKGTFSPLNFNKLPENFTFEFDVYASDQYSYYSTFLNIGFVTSKTKTDYTKWSQYTKGDDGVILKIHPQNEGVPKIGRSRVAVVSGKAEILKNEARLSSFNHNQNRVKVQIWRQKNRLRMYVNGEKVWDLPNAFQEVKYNCIVFYTHVYQKTDAFYISNLRLAEAGEDTRHKLIATGTFTTNEILFDFNKATIKSSAKTVLTELGNALKDNPTIKISITGHTDNVGTDQANQKLSEQRAESVKDYLALNFGIEKSKMITFGKGASEPIVENTSEENKQQNRRVEFNIIH